MIVNVPTAEELRTVSLRLYFKAWADLTEITREWHEFSGRTYQEKDGDSSDWRDYIEAAQSDLQGIYTLIQQSQEIGLKARICEVSPFLLLKRTDVKPVDADAGIWDFTDFPTIDAVELVRVHNTFCSAVLSKEFQASYDDLRRSRNKISHLGIYRETIDPNLIIDILRTHYIELYPGRRWMADRLHFAALHRLANYVDNEYSERAGLFYELWYLLPSLSDTQFEWLMRHERHEPRFICHPCATDARLGEFEPYAGDVPTAFRVDQHQVHCVICDESTAVKGGRCTSPDCSGSLLSAEADYGGACMSCGDTIEDVA